jgi:hypothetical protein
MWFGISLWWVLLAAVVYFAIGALWYSPVLFAKQWASELGKKMGDMGDAKTSMIVTFLAMLVLVLVEAYFISVTGTHGAMRGAYLGAKIWVGFIATTALVNNTFQGASKKLFAIDQGYHLVGLVVAGFILVH